MSSLVITALELYIETLPLENMSVDHPDFHDLYSKECQLFRVLRMMNWEEGEEYRYQVRCYNIDHGIRNSEPKWNDEGPEYDSAGFTEEDCIVDGQYMNLGENKSTE
jgi:hypothetical protein